MTIFDSLKGKNIFAGLSCVMTIVCADLDYNYSLRNCKHNIYKLSAYHY